MVSLYILCGAFLGQGSLHGGGGFGVGVEGLFPSPGESSVTLLGVAQVGSWSEGTGMVQGSAEVAPIAALWEMLALAESKSWLRLF